MMGTSSVPHRARDEEDSAMTVLVAARPGPLRESLHALLQAMPQVREVLLLGASASLTETIAVRRPALVVWDGDLANGAMAACRESIRAAAYGHRCLVLANSVQQQEEAQRAGADLAVLKGHPAAELARAIAQLLAAVEERT
jgi:DNA-binding NarL/FixJ family response regulator